MGINRKCLPIPLVTFPVSDASTCHITAKDNEILKSFSNIDHEDGGTREIHPQVVLRYYYGFIVSVWHWQSGIGMEADELDSIEKKLLSLGHSEAYINLCRVSGLNGCKFLNLDCDGTVYDFFPEYSW